MSVFVNYVSLHPVNRNNVQYACSQFLNILDVFNTDRGSVAHVLESVAQLFAREVDLLMEFAYFLPEALQEQVSTRCIKANQQYKLT